ncbi:MAG: hypothetical protein JXR51_03585, partial [Bacteroidales bacterium]|nr:hypothetical protein [Bacteroidales bacterium]
NGTNGTNGTNGVDGNANVQTYVYNSPAWGTASWMDIDMSDILTDEILQNDVILGYVKNTGFNIVNPIPGVLAGSKNYKVNIFNSNAGSLSFCYRIVSLELDGSETLNADLLAADWVKVVIIESTNTTSVDGNGKKRLNSQQAIYDELDKAGVDINNYYQVMDYYGLEY